MTAWTIISLGNRFRGDDAAGPYVLDCLKCAAGKQLACIENGGDMPQLLEDWKHRRVILIDALMDDCRPAGTLLRFDGLRQAIPASLCQTSSHGLNLGEAIELGRILGALPRQLTVYAICGADFGTGTPLSPSVRATADTIAQEVLTRYVMEEGGPQCTNNP